MRATTVLLITASATLLSASALPAMAEECSRTAYGGIVSSYGFEDTGDTYYNKPLFQGGVTLACGKLSFDGWNSSGLSTRGTYGNRGSQDEVDATVSYTDSFASPIGRLEATGTAAYWLLSSFKRTSDDYAAFTLTIGRPITMGKATVKPYVRATEWVGFGSQPDYTFIRPGVTLSVPLARKWTLAADAGWSHDLRHGRNTRYVSPTISRDIGNGWSVNAGAKLIEHTRAVFILGASKTF